MLRRDFSRWLMLSRVQTKPAENHTFTLFSQKQRQPVSLKVKSMPHFFARV